MKTLFVLAAIIYNQGDAEFIYHHDFVIEGEGDVFAQAGAEIDRVRASLEADGWRLGQMILTRLDRSGPYLVKLEEGGPS